MTRALAAKREKAAAGAADTLETAIVNHKRAHRARRAAQLALEKLEAAHPELADCRLKVSYITPTGNVEAWCPVNLDELIKKTTDKANRAQYIDWKKMRVQHRKSRRDLGLEQAIELRNATSREANAQFEKLLRFEVRGSAEAARLARYVVDHLPTHVGGYIHRKFNSSMTSELYEDWVSRRSMAIDAAMAVLRTIGGHEKRPGVGFGR